MDCEQGSKTDFEKKNRGKARSRLLIYSGLVFFFSLYIYIYTQSIVLIWCPISIYTHLHRGFTKISIKHLFPAGMTVSFFYSLIMMH